MPYFSFSLKQNFLLNKDDFLDLTEIKANIVYFSKNTKLWKNLNKKQNKHFINFINFEKRKKIYNISGKVLFCLPPSIGLGDSIEYALAFKSIFKKKEFKDAGIAFCGKYKTVFVKYFKFKNVYSDVVMKNIILNYDTVFHVTLELPQLKFQKYIRSNIEDILTKYFNVKKNRLKLDTKKKQPIKKITIYPISKSPIRSMPLFLLNEIINYYQNEFEVIVVYDKFSQISEYLQNNTVSTKYKKLFPSTLDNLFKIINTTEYGIFMDSGPLHIAKFMGIKGIFLESSVSSKILLDQFYTISVINNSFFSKYCASPCGLTNIFNINGKLGCYESLLINQIQMLKIKNINSMQRGALKKNYIDYMLNPVGCLKNLDSKNIINQINKSLDK